MTDLDFRGIHNRYFGDKLPDFAHAKIEQWDEVAFQKDILPFVSKHWWHGCKTINVLDVAGTKHPDYHGLTWLEFLKIGKRMTSNLEEFRLNPGYYTAKEQKMPSMYFLQIDGGSLYVGEDGNHRTAIARFGFHSMNLSPVNSYLHGVTVTDYGVDWAIKDRFDQIIDIVSSRRLPYHVRPVRELIRRSDGAGWMCDHYSVSLEVFDASCGDKSSLKSVSEIDSFISKIGVVSIKSKILTALKRFFSMLLPVVLVVLLHPLHSIASDFCFEEAGKQYGVSPVLLWSLSKAESDHDPHAINVNRNGTYDYCHMQINSSWAKKIGLDLWATLGDSCQCTKVGAWILSKCIEEHGHTWEAVGCYHSKNKARRIHYAWKIHNTLASALKK